MEGVIKLYEDCGCEAVIGEVKCCEKHWPQDYSEASLRAHLEWREKLLADVKSAQQNQNVLTWLDQAEA